MAAIEVDAGQWPLLHIRMEGRPSDEQFTRYLEEVRTHLDRGEDYALVISTPQGMPISSPTHLKMQAAWTRDNEQTIARLCLGIAFVLPSPAMRGVLRAALAFQKLPTEHQVFRSENDGRNWARSRLEHAGTRARGNVRIVGSENGGS